MFSLCNTDSPIASDLKIHKRTSIFFMMALTLGLIVGCGGGGGGDAENDKQTTVQGVGQVVVGTPPISTNGGTLITAVPTATAELPAQQVSPHPVIPETSVPNVVSVNPQPQPTEPVLSEPPVTSVTSPVQPPVTLISVVGNLVGLKEPASLRLGDGLGNMLWITSNGIFKFARTISPGLKVNVVVEVQPSGQVCKVSNGRFISGQVNGTEVKVACQEFAPKKMAFFYYDEPSQVNDSKGNLRKAIEEFAKFDAVVWGTGLELPQGPSNGDICSRKYSNEHEILKSIIKGVKSGPLKTESYGYVFLNADLDNSGKLCAWTTDEMKTRIDMWLDAGVDGIFVDQLWITTGVSKVKVNQILHYIHSKGAKVILNPSSGIDMYDYFRKEFSDAGLMRVLKLTGSIASNSSYTMSTALAHAFTVGDTVRLLNAYSSEIVRFPVTNIPTERSFEFSKSSISVSISEASTVQVLLSPPISGAENRDIELFSGDKILLEAFGIEGGKIEPPARTALRLGFAQTLALQYGVEVIVMPTPSECDSSDADCNKPGYEACRNGYSDDLYMYARNIAVNRRFAYVAAKSGGYFKCFNYAVSD